MSIPVKYEERESVHILVRVLLTKAGGFVQVLLPLN